MSVNQVIIHKGRTTVLPVSLPYDVSEDIITSQVRVEKNRTSTLLGEWEVSYETDGVDGELIFVFDDAVSSPIEKTIGYMDIKRQIGGVDGEPVSVLNEPLQVLIQEVVTV